jgi:hypothetical protein
MSCRSIRALADRIYQSGQLQSLMVVPTEDSRYYVVAGDRRFAALAALLTAGQPAKPKSPSTPPSSLWVRLQMKGAGAFSIYATIARDFSRAQSSQPAIVSQTRGASKQPGAPPPVSRLGPGKLTGSMILGPFRKRYFSSPIVRMPLLRPGRRPHPDNRIGGAGVLRRSITNAPETKRAAKSASAEPLINRNLGIDWRRALGVLLRSLAKKVLNLRVITPLVCEAVESRLGIGVD